MKTYDFLVFIGRFQPFHLGHESVVREALEISNHIIILVGSSYQPPSFRNPWNFEERSEFIRASFSKEENDRISIEPLLDYMYSDQQWIKSIQQIVNGVVYRFPLKIATTPKIGLIGHDKDHTSYYLSMFPQWKSINVEANLKICATPIRESYFVDGKISDTLHSGVKKILKEYQQSKNYGLIQDEHHFIKKYKKGWESTPYEPIFITVDAVVVQAGHILLVERKANPGKGLFALPGGFINADEKLKNAVIRELREETKIKVPLPVLAGSITKQEVFDNPHRSARGRTITHAYLIELKSDKNGLPKVKGSDDAKSAFWVPYADVKPQNMFEDHYHIIQAMLG